MAKIIDGKAISAKIREEIRNEVEDLKKRGIIPGLAVMIVGDDPASQIYVRNKEKACAEVGIYSEVIRLPQDALQEEVIAKIEVLNARRDIHGILVQLPLPPQISAEAVIGKISPEKDVDAFCPENVGKIMTGNYALAPCTPAGIIELLEKSGVDICGKNCVVVGRSNIVGKPMAMLLLHKNGTVTVCHSKTQNLAEITRTADILVVAVGKARFITADMIKPGAVVIDVGMNRGSDGKLCGDVDFDAACKVASMITPVPGGVGPMTVTELLKNTVKSSRPF